MKIKDGLNLKGRWIEIPDCFRDDLPQFFKEMNFKVGAEIGVFKGEFTEKLCQAGLKMYAIDPWLEYNDYTNQKDYQKVLTSCYDEAKNRLQGYDCTFIKKNSMDALQDIEDESLDFVYIDGNHQFKYVAEDICEWAKKVKKGGVISGHDYYYSAGTKSLNANHVRYVVDAYIGTYQINKLYVLGKRKSEIRDKWRSWFFIK